METIRIVDVRTGEGSYINFLDSEELLEVRKMIEVQATFYAAKRISEQEIQELEQVLFSMKMHNNDSGLTSWEKADHQFHFVIAKASHNRIAIRLMDMISDQIRHVIRESQSKLFEGKYTPELLYQEHVDIFRAIKNRDAELARDKMLKHLNGIEEAIMKVF